MGINNQKRRQEKTTSLVLVLVLLGKPTSTSGSVD